MTLRNYRAAYWISVALALGASARAAPEPADPKGQSPPPTPPPASVNPAAPASEKPAPKPRPRLSEHITSQITSSLPPWSPPPPEPAEKAPPPPPDPNVVRMAPVIVKDYHLPRIEDKEWLSPKALDTALVKEYIPPFDRDFLNRFTLPIVGISPEARARMMYEEEKRLRDLKWMNDEIDQMKRLDPQGANDLKGIRDSTFTRPGD